MISAPEALDRLRDGNRRFVAGQSNRSAFCPVTTGGGPPAQEPFAIILGCSDSRVPAELVFDQGIGDLFVIRVAGNIVAPSQVGSVEFAAEHFGTRLVVVLGHSMCGAVLAMLDDLEQPSQGGSPNVRSIVDCIRPALAPLMGNGTRDELVPRAVQANIRASVDGLREGSPVLAGLVEKGDLMVVGAEYALETGVVTFLDGAPES